MKKATICFSVTLLLISLPTFDSAAKRRAPYRCPAKPTKVEEIEKLAGKLFDAGEAHARKGNYPLSLKKFLCSATIAEHMNTTLNIAQAARLIKRKKLVLRFLRHYVKKNPDTTTAKDLKKIIKLIEKKK